MTDLAESSIKRRVLWADTLGDQHATEFRFVGQHDESRPDLKPTYQVEVRAPGHADFMVLSFEHANRSTLDFVLGGIFQAGLASGRKVGIGEEQRRCQRIAELSAQRDRENAVATADPTYMGGADAGEQIAQMIDSGKPLRLLFGQPAAT